ncbi:MAG: helicase-exonuclease AddAB subunit AddA [Lachnospiraceae bacterium]|nr:helicase-exonuclease AddAB subunit AddA [Lachnospiraceae bacterium]
MKEIRYTDEQLKAINTRNRNLLVSAAAGSGKTAVLVERIIRRVTDKTAPVDIDRILVMTFTRAAADQMREKILDKVAEMRLADPEDLHLQKQAALIHTAHISTIHGFCTEVLRNHFNEAGIEPDFRIADEGELKLISADVVEEVLEEAYETADPSFIELSESIATGKSDKKLEDAILGLSKFALSYPDPDEWLDKVSKLYTGPDVAENTLTDSLFNSYISDIEEIMEACRRLLCQINSSETLESYAPSIEADISALALLLNAKDCFDLSEKIRGFKFVTLGCDSAGKKVKSDVKPDENEKKSVSDLREKIKKMVKKIAVNLGDRTREEETELIHKTAGEAVVLTEMVRKYLEKFEEKKRKANILDFGDLEHLAIKVLKSEEGAVAEEYRGLFEEIYVDEYQDSNLVQEELINLVSRKNNVFMVGDVKQSIYAFRMARPELFMQKYERFSGCPDENNAVVDLKHNFRSRKSVIDSVNEIFSVIMKKKNGMIEYNDNHKLIFGFEEYPEDTKTDKTEVILIEGDRGIDPKELEASVIVDKINSLRAEKKVYDAKNKCSRELRYSDIVVLFRSFTDASVYKKVLEESGIPVHVMSNEGYFEAEEVALLLDYLRIIDNPGQDIPLASVLKSFFCKMTDDELALIRSGNKDCSLYESLKITAGKNENNDKIDDKIKYIYNNAVIKSRDFITQLTHYRSLIGYTSVYELLAEIISGGYSDYLLTRINGRKKCSNVEMLLKKSEDFAKTSFKGLFQFVRYIDKLKKYEVDFGQANLTDENEDTVRFMTIHKSKGLEFPVCFVVNVGKRYNEQDVNSDLIPDMDYGIGLNLVDLKRRTKTGTLISRALKRKKLSEIRAEEMRILYVAMTRAREKLIMTAVCKDTAAELSKERILSAADSFLDLILYVRQRMPLQSVAFSETGVKDLVFSRVEKEIVKGEAEKKLFNIIDTTVSEEAVLPEETEYYRFLRNRIEYRYEKSGAEESFQKYSVTELKKKHLENALREEKDSPGEGDLPELFPEDPDKRQTAGDNTETVPLFMQEKTKIPAGLHGTAVHRIFELWDYDRKTDMDSIKDFIREAVDKGLIERQMAGSVTAEEIYDFVNSPLASRMRKAYKNDRLHREQPFVIELDGQLIQGIIDAYFIEDDEIVVVDYKTDKTGGSKTLVDRYEIQLDYYARTLERLLEKRVREKIIYSTVLKKSIIL